MHSFIAPIEPFSCIMFYQSFKKKKKQKKIFHITKPKGIYFGEILRENIFKRYKR